MADSVALDVLGGAVTYTPTVGVAVEVRGIFDAAYVAVDVSGGRAGVAEVGPSVFLSLADLPSDPSEDAATLTVNSVNYSIKESQPDGLGGVRLLLFEV